MDVTSLLPLSAKFSWYQFYVKHWAKPCGLNISRSRSGLKSVLPQNYVSQNLRMWPYLEVGFPANVVR